MRNLGGNSDRVIDIAVIIDKSGKSRHSLNSNINPYKLDDDFRREQIAHGLFIHY